MPSDPFNKEIKVSHKFFFEACLPKQSMNFPLHFTANKLRLWCSPAWISHACFYPVTASCCVSMGREDVEWDYGSKIISTLCVAQLHHQLRTTVTQGHRRWLTECNSEALGCPHAGDGLGSPSFLQELTAAIRASRAPGPQCGKTSTPRRTAPPQTDLV